MPSKPKLRLIHNMGRSGSTLMCKCLGCMQGNALLSEIHPAATQLFNPLNQAHGWFQLLTKKDVVTLQQGKTLGFIETIRLIERRCRQKKRRLLIRDWAHLDFTGLPFVESPGLALSLADVLCKDFRLIQLFMVRHPIDQWLSISRLPIMQEAVNDGRLSVAGFIKGYEAFARHCSAHAFIRYEDFTHQPESLMQQACGHLELPYDPAFMQRWPGYKTITGDVQSTRGGDDIRPLKRRPCEAGVLKEFESEESYWNSLTLLGYGEADLAGS